MRLLDHAQRLLHLLPPVRTIMDDNVRLQRQLVELAAELATVRAAGGIAERAAAELPKLREQVKELKEEAHQARGEAQALLLRLEAVGRGLHLYRLLREVTAPPTGKHAVFIEKVDEWERKHGRVVDPDPRTGRPGGADLLGEPGPGFPLFVEVQAHERRSADGRGWWEGYNSKTKEYHRGVFTVEGGKVFEFRCDDDSTHVDAYCAASWTFKPVPPPPPAGPDVKPEDRAPNMRRHRWERPVLESTPCLDCGVRFEHARGPCPGPKGGDGG